MSKTRLSLLAACVAASLPHGLLAEETTVNPRFVEVQKKLDQGGTAYVYLDLKDSIRTGIDGLFDMLEKSAARDSDMDGAAIRDVRVGLTAAADRLGLFAIEDLGMSAIREGDRHRIKSYLRIPGEATGLKRILGGEPSARKQLHLAPETAVFFMDGDLSLRELFAAVRSIAKTAPPPAFRGVVESYLSLAENEMHLPVSSTAEALDGEIALAVTLDETHPVTLPGDGASTTTLPAPGFILAIESSTDAPMRLADALMVNYAATTESLTVANPERGYRIAVPPGPLPLSPCFAFDDGFFYVASEESLLAGALERRRSGSGGMADTAEFKDELGDLPLVNNGLAYSSPRLGRILKSIAAQGRLEGAEELQQVYALGEGSIQVRLNDADGILCISRSHAGIAQQVMGGFITPAIFSAMITGATREAVEAREAQPPPSDEAPRRVRRKGR